MKSKFLSVASAALGLAFALSATTASAGLINNYNFAGNAGQMGMTETFNGTVAGGPSVKVTAYSNSKLYSWLPETVNQGNGVLGVNSNPDDSRANRIGGQVEGLLFDLGSVYSGSFTFNFSTFGKTDSADVWIGSTDNFVENYFMGAQQIADDSFSSLFTSGPANFRYIFVTNDSENVTGTCGDLSNCFGVDNLQVIPEPGSLALVGAALLLAGAVRRRRNAA